MGGEGVRGRSCGPAGDRGGWRSRAVFAGDDGEVWRGWGARCRAGWALRHAATHRPSLAYSEPFLGPFLPSSPPLPNPLRSPHGPDRVRPTRARAHARRRAPNKLPINPRLVGCYGFCRPAPTPFLRGLPHHPPRATLSDNRIDGAGARALAAAIAPLTALVSLNLWYV